MKPDTLLISLFCTTLCTATLAPTISHGQAAPKVGGMPSSLVGTWFAGKLLPRTLYDPSTNTWGSANGLGQMYTFNPDGTYTYNAFFRIQTYGCYSEVAVYQKGSAQATEANLTLTASTAKTRTVTQCGNRRESVVEGTHESRSLPWTIARDQYGKKQLTITENGKPTAYSKQGMAEELVGTWREGTIQSNGFYNPATGTFAARPGEGVWIKMTPDGRYSWGEFGYRQDAKGCQLAGWLYMEGMTSVSGGRVTFTPDSGSARVENACTPNQPQQKSWKDNPKSFTWLFRDFSTSPKLVLSEDARFGETVLLPESP